MNILPRHALPLVLLSALPGATAWGAQGMKGDAQAVLLARRMIDRMGDRSAWARATAMHVVEEAYPPGSEGPVRYPYPRLAAPGR